MCIRSRDVCQMSFRVGKPAVAVILVFNRRPCQRSAVVGIIALHALGHSACVVIVILGHGVSCAAYRHGCLNQPPGIVVFVCCNMTEEIAFRYLSADKVIRNINGSTRTFSYRSDIAAKIISIICGYSALCIVIVIRL